MNRRVLVVEDDPVFSRVLSDVLANAGFDVDAVLSGAQAIERTREQRYDLVTLDLMMPEPNGWSVLEAITALETPPAVVIVSGRTAVLSEPHPLRECVAAVIYKPWGVTELPAVCEAVLQLRRERQGPGAAERRGQQRRLLMMPVEVPLESSSEREAGMLHSVSAVGAQLRCETLWHDDRVFGLSIRFPGSPTEFVIDARVVYCRPEASSFVYGLAFMTFHRGTAAELDLIVKGLAH